jgi:hypothetical protein
MRTTYLLAVLAYNLATLVFTAVVFMAGDMALAQPLDVVLPLFAVINLIIFSALNAGLLFQFQKKLGEECCC